MSKIPFSGRLLRPLALLLPLALVSGAPALSGCDSGLVECDDDAEFSTEDLTPDGTELGAAVQPGTCVTVRYEGRLADGSGTFDAGTFDFVYPNGVIQGFALGMVEQQVGETRRIVVPPQLGYRAQEVPDRDPDDDRVGIPACSTLEFDVTVLAVNRDVRVCSGV